MPVRVLHIVICQYVRLCELKRALKNDKKIIFIKFSEISNLAMASNIAHFTLHIDPLNKITKSLLLYLPED